ncbi:MAG TPA: multidrug efflux RND transporter permease subunit [Candidatus Polarisedimenticolaceae bacterium]
MAFARWFVDRPIPAMVVSILIVLAGLLSLGRLPLAEYPDVAPPTVVVRASYPGANPEVIAETVASPIEQEIHGLDGMLYMTSQASGDGALSIQVTFAHGVDPEMAQVEVQNRVARALPRLPEEVQRIGVVTQKTSPDMLMVVHLVSPDRRYDLLHLSNFAVLQIKDELARLEGVGDVVVWGSGDYALRVWLDPGKVAARGMTASDVVAALREQNVQVAAGVVGQPPEASAPFQLGVHAMGRLSTVEQFEEVVVKTGERGEIVRLRDVARVELGSNRYALRSLLDNEPAVGIQIVQSPEASALATASRVREAMERLREGFPQGIEYRIAYDPTIFVRASIDNVVRTLFEAIALVVIVVVLFLQTWRASLIPLAAVPVSLVGTFAVMHLFGFSLNTLSLFGLVLSIGIVVDDAIVVVENVERHLRRGLSPREAAHAAMGEVTGPILAITSVLVAVFVPTAFLGGLTGMFYRQFALTIAISTVLSAFNSLTLSPALAAVLLKPHGAPSRSLVARAFAAFERTFERASGGYVRVVTRVVRSSAIAIALYAGLLGLTAVGFREVPTGFVPAQDKYYLVGIVQLPAGASLDRTESIVRRATEVALAQPGIESVVAFPGLSINGFTASPSAAVFFAMLDPFESRRDEALSSGAIAGALNAKFSSIGDAFVAAFPPPPVHGLGNLGGFKLQVQDRAGRGYDALQEATRTLLAAAEKDGRFVGLFSNFQTNVPQLHVDVDRQKAKLQGVDLRSLFETLQINLGSLYVNDFNTLGRTYQVIVQADAVHRRDAESVSRLWARNDRGELVPVAALARVRPDTGPDPVTRHDAFPAADVNGAAAPRVGSAEAVAAMEELARTHLPDGFTIAWTDLTYQQRAAGNAASLVFPVAILLAFLILAAQYGSWSLPLAVMLVVPTVLFSALAGVWLRGGDNNLFTQIGLVVLVGLAAKNAILLVEFARQRERSGATPLEAVLDAARLRLRPILMTSAAFVMGVLPLVFASGAGAEMRRAMGLAVFSGMIGVTVFGLLLTPVFYLRIRRRRAPRLALRPVAPALLVALAAVSGAAAATPPDAFGTQAPGLVEGPASVERWWERFGDPVLDGLVVRALERNHDVREGVARVDAARAARRGARHEFGPSGGASVAVERRERSAHEAPGATEGERRSETRTAGIDLSWEADLFGRVRNANRAAQARLDGTLAALSDVRRVVAAEVVEAYFDARGSEMRIDTLRRYRDDQAKVVELNDLLALEGRVAGDVPARARAELASNEARLLDARDTLAAAVHALALLLGEVPGAWHLPESAPLGTLVLEPIAIGDPASLIAGRPDVAAAAREVDVRRAEIGIAAADLFPRLTLGGFFGVVAGGGGELGSAGSSSWFVVPSLRWGVFDLGRTRARVRVRRAEAEAALVAYERVVLRALEEAENAFQRFGSAQARLLHRDVQAREATRAAAIAAARHEEGADTYLAALIARRDALQAALDRIDAVVDHRRASVAVFRAL